MKLLDKLCERGQHCSCFFDGIKLPFTNKYILYWGNCCKEHDDCYDELEKNDSTKPCDGNMKRCIQKKIKLLAYGMYSAVRVFGRYFKKN